MKLIDALKRTGWAYREQQHRWHIRNMNSGWLINRDGEVVKQLTKDFSHRWDDWIPATKGQFTFIKEQESRSIVPVNDKSINDNKDGNIVERLIELRDAIDKILGVLKP